MYQDMEEREISIKEMVVYALRRWRLMLILGIALGVLAGVYHMYSGLRSWDSDIAAYDSAIASYNDNYDTYEQQQEQIETEIETIMKSVDEQEEYLENSILMNMDAHNKMQASVDVVVRMDDAALASYGGNSDYDPADSLLSLYVNSIRKGSDWDKIAEMSKVAPEYVEELVSTWTNTDGNIISISVSHPDKEVAVKILEEILNEMMSRHDEMASGVGEHTLTTMKLTVGTINDADLLSQQTQAKEVLATYNQKISEKQTALEALVAPEAITVSQPSKRNLIVKSIMYAVIGFIAGICIIGVIYCAVFIIDGKVHSEEELNDLHAVRSLGVLPQPVKKRAFAAVDGWLDRLAGIDRNITREQAEQLIILNVQNYAGEAKEIFVTGSVAEEELSDIRMLLAEHLSDKNVMAGANMQKNIDAYKAAMACDAIVLVEKMYVSKCVDIWKEKEFAESLGKKIAGCVLI